MGRGTTQLNANSSCRMWHYNAIFAAPGQAKTESAQGRFLTSSTNVVLGAMCAKWTQTLSKPPEIEQGKRQRSRTPIERDSEAPSFMDASTVFRLTALAISKESA